MGARFDDAPLLHHHDLIGMAHGAEAMGNHQGGSGSGDPIQGPLNGGLGFVVDGGCGFIEHQHRGIFQDGSGQGNALALPTGQPLAPLSHHGVVALRQGFNKPGGLGEHGCLLDGSPGGAKAAISNVLGHGAVEEEDFLAHQADGLAEVLEFQPLDPLTIQEDLAALNLIEAQQQFDDRALA